MEQFERGRPASVDHHHLQNQHTMQQYQNQLQAQEQSQPQPQQQQQQQQQLHVSPRSLSNSPHPNAILSSSTSPPPFTNIDDPSTLNNFVTDSSISQQSTASGAYDPNFTSDLAQQAQYFFNLQAQEQQSQINNFVSQQATFVQSQPHPGRQYQSLPNAHDLNSLAESNNFPSLGIVTRATFDGTTGLDPSLLANLDTSDLGLLSAHSSPGNNGGSPNGTLDHMAATLSREGSLSSPHHLQPDLGRRQSPSPSPQQSPSFQHVSFTDGRPRNLSESLDPRSALFPQGQNEWMNMGAYQHRRNPSDNFSDVSSTHASPYLTHLDSFDAANSQASPLLNANTDPVFENGLGLGAFNLNENNFPQQGFHTPQSFHTPAHSPGHSPLLMPQPQQGLPPFVADNKFGLSTGMNGSFGQHAADVSDPYALNASESFPAFNPASSPGGMSDQMSPPAINIDFVPTQHNPVPTLKTEVSDDALMPPARTARARAKSDSHAGSRKTNIGRARSPSLQPDGGMLDDMLMADNANGDLSSAPSPRGRGSSASHRSRSHSNTSRSSDRRDYILDLADPSRPSTNGANGGGSQRVQKHPATYQCSLCPKRFTRAYNLRSHLRTHTDERPFVCTVCGKAFARQHDRKRHEGLHSGEKKFVCRGVLQSGSHWGCNRRFARADALGRHFRSEAGRVCIKPLLDEEAAERQAQTLSNSSTSYALDGSTLQPNYSDPSQLLQVGGGLGLQPLPVMSNFLPQALLAQYPALATIDWNNLAATAPGGLNDDDDPDDGGSGYRGSYDPSSGGEYMDDLSENDEMSYATDASNGGGDPTRQNFGAMQQHQQQQQQQQYALYAAGNNQNRDYLSDFEGR